MDVNDFLGSVAQEDILFTTRVVKTARVGDNFWRGMIFVESDRFVDATSLGWTDVPGATGVKALSVGPSDFAEHTTGVLRSWLYDLFCNGFTGDCILVACGPHSTESTPSSTAFIEKMTLAYNTLKAYAYHKTVCAAPTLALDTAAFVLDTDVCVELAELCANDKGLLSSAPYFPYTSTTPETITSDALYNALKTADADAFMSAHQDSTRNAALYSLGLAMSTLNGSGTCVGNSMDMIKSSLITPSGTDGTNLPKAIRDSLFSNNVQTFKPVGNNTGNVAAKGASTLKGDVVQATWIVAYITYMVKVAVAELITVPNFLKNNDSYSQILGIMSNYLKKFGDSGSRRLKDIQVTAPSFGALPEAQGDEIIVPDAWAATYVDQVRKVQITGTLYIGE